MPRPKQYDYNQSVAPLRAVVLGYVLDRKIATKSDIAQARRWVDIVMRETGVSGSCNQFKLAACSGHILDMVTTDELTAIVAAESLNCWFRAGCGTPAEQPPNLTHGALNLLGDTYSALIDIPLARYNIERIFNLIREIDVYGTGFAFAAGARSSNAFAKARKTGTVPRCDVADLMAGAILGDKLSRSKVPSSQDCVAVIQEKMPELIEATWHDDLPPLFYPLEITTYANGVVTLLPTAPPRESRFNPVTRTWAVVENGRVKVWGWEDEEPPLDLLGSPVFVDTTPQGVIV